jgi:IMP dehydrogenase
MADESIKHVEDIMTKSIETVSKDASVSDAATKMRDQEINSLLVPGPEMGIITSTDVLDAVAEERDLQDFPVSSLMTAPVESITVDVPLQEAAAMMRTYGINHLPVRDTHGDYIGIVSTTDLRQTLGDSAIGR